MGRATSEGPLHKRIVERIGRDIVDGALSAGDVFRLEDLARDEQVSRTVARDVMKELESLGLIRTRRRIGLVVQPESEWNVMHPLVIAWRIASPFASAQLRSLCELRLGIEPVAAAFAARRRTAPQAKELLLLADELGGTGRKADAARYAELDVRFHTLILDASDNEMLRAMRDSLSAALRARANAELMPSQPHEHSFALHTRVATAIDAREPEAASAAMQEIITEVLREVS